jgi:TolA-binding protein
MHRKANFNRHTRLLGGSSLQILGRATVGCVFAFSLLPSVPLCQVAAPVSDLTAQDADVDPKAQATMDLVAVPSGNDMFVALQSLREELRLLRGTVETLEFRLQQVKQQQLDDYLDLDRRLAAQGLNITSNDDPAEVDAVMSSPDKIRNYGPVSSLSPPEMSHNLEVKQDYDLASALLLRERDIIGATLAFRNHIVKYPTSPFVANASYWLGEIFLLQGEDEQAKLEFTRIVDDYAGHPKEIDAKFKLGKIYFQLGERARSRDLMESVANSEAPVAVKAKKYLEANF